MKKTILLCLSFVLSLSILTGCSNNSEELIADAKEHFQTNKNVTYEEPEVLLDSNHTFSFTCSDKALKELKSNKDSMFAVYIDDALTLPIDTKTNWEEETVTIAPNLDPKSFSYHNKEYDFLKTNTWGLYNHYYLVQYFDLETGKILKKPIVTVFTIDTPLESPQVTIKQEKDQSYTFSWDAVSGAEEYYLIRMDFEDDGYSEMEIISDTKKTSWNSKKDGNTILDVNAEIFKSYGQTEDEQYSSSEEYWWASEMYSNLGSIFGIVAKKENAFSSMSYLDTTKTPQEEIVCRSATFASSEIGTYSDYTSIEQIPYQLPASACDGNTINTEVILDSKEISIEADGLHIPYHLRNSSIENAFVISSYNPDTYKQEIESKIENNHTNYEKETSHEYPYKSKKVVAFNIKESNTLPEITDSMFGTSELETFITANMIDGAAKIDISSLDNEYSETYIYDLLEQILSQNPIILRAEDYYYDTFNSTIYIQYSTDRNTQLQIQQTIRDEVARISKEICTPEMSDVEKIYAINQYICDITEYSYETVEADDDTRAKEYYYANTAEGVFIRHSAVCEGYAAAFILLADAVGIDSIMVTGYSGDETEVRHAWNRVLVDDQWYVVDPTHNDSEETPNSVVLLADASADTLYREDEWYLVDEYLDKYAATGDDIYEYYRSRNLTVSTSNATSVLMNQLQGNASATVRLPLDTTEAQYDQIGQAIADGLRTSITFYYLNGVLTVYK